jgi:hypothetical protein
MQRLCTLGLLTAAALGLGQASLGGGKAAAFFNGKDLEGWHGLSEYWKVEEGKIVGATPKGLTFNTFLCSKNAYRDFELVFKVKMTKSGNSGVQIRSQIINEKTLAVGGPQCDMGQVYWGSLYGEHYDQKSGKIGGGGGMMKAAPGDVVKKVLKDGDWNDYYIKCVGKHVTIKLNGATTVDDDFNLPESGIIAWQLHAGGPMEVIFDEVRFKDLSK